MIFKFGSGKHIDMTDIKEPFELIQLLGTGGFAQTWSARVLDPELVEEYRTGEVAVKIPLTKQKERVLKKELQLTGSLHLQLTAVESSHIVRYFGFEIFDGKPVMVMEYVRGGSLRNLIGKFGSRRKIDVEPATEIIRGILEGLSVIHKKHIIHRDIKPENILMDGKIPKIADLGISRMLRPDEMASTAIGTLYYMPPELLYGKSATYNVDLWSLGFTFYEMLYAQFPFGIQADMPPARIIGLITDDKVPVIFPRGEAVSAEIRRIITRMLDKSPQNRYKTAAQVLKDMSRLKGPVPEPGHTDVEVEIGKIKEMMQDPTQASAVEERLQQMLRRFPDSPRVYLLGGEFFNKKGNHRRAVEWFRKGIKLEPRNALLHWDLANALQQSGELTTALQTLQTAVALGLDRSLERYARILMRNLEKQLK